MFKYEEQTTNYNQSYVSSMNIETEQDEEDDDELFKPIKMRRFSSAQEYDVFLGILQKSRTSLGT